MADEVAKTPAAAERQCASCRGTNLVEGNLTGSVAFKPEKNWVTSHRIKALACLDCGAITPYLDQRELWELRGHPTPKGSGS